jgi:hypothetical protein
MAIVLARRMKATKLQRKYDDFNIKRMSQMNFKSVTELEEIKE